MNFCAPAIPGLGCHQSWDSGLVKTGFGIAVPMLKLSMLQTYLLLIRKYSRGFKPPARTLFIFLVVHRKCNIK